MLQHLANIFRLGMKELISLRHDADDGVPDRLFLHLRACMRRRRTPRSSWSTPRSAIVDEDRSQLSRRIRDALLPPFFLEPPVRLRCSDDRSRPWTPGATPS